MIYDKRGVIKKLDEKSLITFLNNNKQPLILYGTGDRGSKLYNKLRQADIKVDMWVDSSKEKQGQLKEGKTIQTPEYIAENIKNPIIWIAVASDEYAKQILDTLNSLGIKKDIMVYNLLNAESLNYYEDYYQDYDINLPNIILGTGDNAKEIERQLKKEGAKDIRYCNIKKSDISNQNISLNLEDIDGKNCNFFISKMEDWINTTNILMQMGVYDKIYKGYRDMFGEFNIKNNIFEVNIIKILMFRLMCFINRDYYYLDEESSKILRKVCEEFFENGKNKNIFDKTIIEEHIEDILELDSCQRFGYEDEILSDGKKEYVFENIYKDIYSFLTFLYTLNYMVDKKNKISLKLNTKLKLLIH